MSRVGLVACACAALVVVFIAGVFALSRPAAAADEVAAFELTAEITWSAETAPLEFPAGAHLSRLVAVTHDGRYVLFRDGHTASSGLELLAENGRAAAFEVEFAEAKRRGRIGSVVVGPNLAKVPGTISVSFETSRDHALFSFATMVAPSPDWFTGAADIDLTDGENWIEEAEVTLWAWDSGTDGGETYTAANQDLQPRQTVRLLASSHFLTEDGLVPVGRAKIRRISP